MWRFQLIDIEKANSFDKLKKYKDELDLELIGLGGYLADGLDISSLNMDDYYKPDHTIFENKGRFGEQQIDLEEIESPIDLTAGHHSQINSKFGRVCGRISSSNSNDLSVANSSVDTFGNLMLGQVVAGKIYGPNRHLTRQSYVLPDLERRMIVDELSKKILPVLKLAPGK